MNDQSARQVAVSAALVIFALTSSFADQIPASLHMLVPGIDPATASWDMSARLLSAGFGGIKLGVLILILERVVFRIAARPFLGKWAYESTAGNFAILQIRVAGFWAGGTRLDYSVTLYRDAKEVSDVLARRRSVAPFGTAHGIMTQLEGNRLQVIYEVAKGAADYDALRGYLQLLTTAAPGTLKGMWESTKVNESDVPDREVRVGDYTAWRPRQFRRRFGIA